MLQLNTEADTLTVELCKSASDLGFGFGIVEGQNPNTGALCLYIARVIPDGVAARDGRLKKAQRVLKVAVYSLNFATLLELIFNFCV